MRKQAAWRSGAEVAAGVEEERERGSAHGVDENDMDDEQWTMNLAQRAMNKEPKTRNNERRTMDEGRGTTGIPYFSPSIIMMNRAEKLRILRKEGDSGVSGNQSES